MLCQVKTITVHRWIINTLSNKVSGIHVLILLVNLIIEAAGSDPFLNQNKRTQDLGLGVDWGVFFSRTDLVYTAVKPDEVKLDTKAPQRACTILEKKNKYS